MIPLTYEDAEEMGAPPCFSAQFAYEERHGLLVDTGPAGHDRDCCCTACDPYEDPQCDTDDWGDQWEAATPDDDTDTTAPDTADDGDQADEPPF